MPAHPGHLVRAAHQLPHAVRQGGPGALGGATGQQRDIALQLVGRDHVGTGLHQLGDDVVARLQPLLLAQLGRVVQQAHDRGDDVLERRRDTGVERGGKGVDPLEELGAVALGHAEHVTECLHRHGVTDVLDEVERALLQRRVDDVDRVLAELLFELLHHRRAQALAHHGALAAVLLAVHHQHGGLAAQLRIRRDRGDPPHVDVPAGRRIQLLVLVDGPDVLVAADHPCPFDQHRVVELVQIARLFIAQVGVLVQRETEGGRVAVGIGLGVEHADDGFGGCHVESYRYVVAGQVDGRVEPLLENQSMLSASRHREFRETESVFARTLS